MTKRQCIKEDGTYKISRQEQDQRNLYYYVHGLRDLVEIRQALNNQITTYKLSKLSGLSLAMIKKVENGKMQTSVSTLSKYMNVMIFIAKEKGIQMRPFESPWGIKPLENDLTDEQVKKLFH